MNKAFSTILTSMLLLLGTVASGQVQYHNAEEFPLYGKVSDATAGRYQRLPASLKGVTRPPVYALGCNSAGLYVRFRSDSPFIRVKWTSSNAHSMNHMADSGTRGVDLYILTDGTWRFVGTGRPTRDKKTTEANLAENMEAKDREYMLYLSLYDGIDDLEIGIDKGASISVPEVKSPSDEKPVVAYGTSILQGGCCSRPGMAFTNIVARRLDREVINLGFSGNGQLDLEIAELMASVENPGLFFLDYVPNCSVEQIREKGEKFFRILRDAHPDVPIIFMDDPFFGAYGVDKRITKEVDSKNAAQAELFAKLKKQGEKKIWHIAGKQTLGTDNESFVDGIHFTDLGMQRYADFITPIIRKHMLR